MYVRSAAMRTTMPRGRKRPTRLGDTITASDIGRAVSGGAILGPAYLWCKYNAPEGAGDDCLAAGTDVIDNLRGKDGGPNLQAQIADAQRQIAEAGKNLPAAQVVAAQQQVAREMTQAANQTASNPSGDPANDIPWTAIGVVAAFGVGAYVMSRV